MCLGPRMEGAKVPGMTNPLRILLEAPGTDTPPQNRPRGPGTPMPNSSSTNPHCAPGFPHLGPFYFYQEGESGLPGGATQLFMSETCKDAQCTWEKAFAVKGISEVSFKPSRVNRCLVLRLLTLEKPHFHSRPAEGPGIGGKCTGVRCGQAAGPSSPGRREKRICRRGGLGRESPLAPQCDFYLSFPQLIPQFLLPP